MEVPSHMHITASLMAGYTFSDGSLVEVETLGNRPQRQRTRARYRVTNQVGLVIYEGDDLRCGARWEDYGEVVDDLAAFLDHYSTEPDDLSESEDMPLGKATLIDWCKEHGCDGTGELCILAGYREDKRLGEGFFAEEE